MNRPATETTYTAGVLFLNQQVNQVKAWMSHSSMPFFVRPLNDKWSILFIQDDKLDQQSSVDLLVEFSKFVSTLYFFHDEDWGWGYRIFVNGFEVACFYDDYHFDHTTAVKLAQERYPHIEDILSYLYFDKEGRALLEELVEEVNNSPEYVEQQFADRNVEFFKIFNIDLENVERLKQLICIEGLRDKRLHWRQVKDFKALLKISELEKMNFHTEKEA